VLFNELVMRFFEASLGCVLTNDLLRRGVLLLYYVIRFPRHSVSSDQNILG